MSPQAPKLVQANWLIDIALKRWVDVQAAERGLRPAHVIEEMIRAMKGEAKP